MIFKAFVFDHQTVANINKGAPPHHRKQHAEIPLKPCCNIFYISRKKEYRIPRHSREGTLQEYGLRVDHKMGVVRMRVAAHAQRLDM